MKYRNGFVLLVFATSISVHAEVTEPGGSADAAQMAMTNPDEYAWQLFMYLNRQAKPGVAGVVDDSKAFGTLDSGSSTVWETWALASGDVASEVYKPDGSKPAKWVDLKRTGRELILDRNLERESVLRQSTGFKPEFVPPQPLSQEVRQNRAHFEFIVDKVMFNRGGIEALFAAAVKAQNRQLIQFPAGAKEIKAEWRPIALADRPRYLWREAKGPNGQITAYGLVSLHIITKDLPNWFWADFGHVDCEVRKGACEIAGQEEARTDPVDVTTRGLGAPSGTNGTRKETIGSVWQNYILRGTQIDFVTPFGRPTILSNPVIENSFQQSSCMTCHARASVGARKSKPNGSPAEGLNTLSPGDPTLGSPDPGLFGAAAGQDEITYVQTDFIWSAPFRAAREK